MTDQEIMDEMINRKLSESHPALMDYSLLASRAQPQTAPMENNRVQPASQDMGEQEMDYPQEQLFSEQEDPIEAGVRKGMEAARRSRKPTGEQDKRALGLALMNFAANFNRVNQPQGFGGTLGAINQALNPAVQAYVNEQNRAESLNAQLFSEENALRRELKKDAFEQEKYRHMEQERKQQRDALNQYRNDMLNIKREDLELKKQKEGVSSTGSGGSGKLTTNAKNAFLKDKQGSGKLIHQLSDIKNQLEDYEKLTAENLVNPSNPYLGKKATSLREFVGYHAPKSKFGKQVNKERLERSTLDSKLTQFRINAERALKGGVLSKGMLDRFEDKNVLPSLNEPFDITKQKIEDLLKEAKDINKVSSYNLERGTNYDLSNLDELEVSEMSDEDLLKARERLKNG